MDVTIKICEYAYTGARDPGKIKTADATSFTPSRSCARCHVYSYIGHNESHSLQSHDSQVTNIVCIHAIHTAMSQSTD